MTEQVTIYLVFGILFLIGLFQLFLPSKAIDLAIKWYGIWGMKVNRNHPLWSDNTMRAVGTLYLASTGYFFYIILQAR